MKITKLSDFTNSDQSVDWAAYNRAKINNGEICYNCFNFILFPKEHQTLCVSCQSLMTSADKQLHSSLIRCPHCKYIQNVADYVGGYDTLYQPESHSVMCPECDKDFEFETIVTYSFESPSVTSE